MGHPVMGAARVLRLAIACMGLMMPVHAQGEAWVRQTLQVTDRNSANGCAKARKQALAEARRYRGLNIIDCTCAPVATKANGPVAGVRCTLTYEVLARRP